MTRVQPPSNNPNVIVTNLGMSVDEVARRCVCAVDKGETFVLMPVWFSRTVRLLYWLFPQFVEGWATLKFMTL